MGESLVSMPAEQQLAEARRYAPLDDDLALFLERLAAANGSREAMVLVGQRAAADPDFDGDVMAFAYLKRAVDAGARDLEPALRAAAERLGDVDATFYEGQIESGAFSFHVAVRAYPVAIPVP